MAKHSSVIDDFDAAWARGENPIIEHVIEKCDSVSTSVLMELAIVDMEYRWKSNANSLQFSADEYCSRFPQLKARMLTLLAEEYRARKIWGDRPDHDQFLARYPADIVTLIRELQGVDEQLVIDEQLVLVKEQTVYPVENDPRAPLPFHDYLLQKHLGTGGMGRVYVAWQKSLNRRVAIKSLRKDRQRDSCAVDAFVQEATLAAKLNHPNIVGIHGIGRFPAGGYFIVMDYIRGDDLETMQITKRYGTDDAIAIAVQIAEGLVHAHQQGVVHCDLKPSNVMLDESDHVYLLDFGMARLQGDNNGSAGGTWAYLAPERMRVVDKVNPRIDVFGVGAILFKLLTDSPPRTGDVGTLRPIQPIEEVTPAIGPDLAQLVNRSLAEAPAVRFDSVADQLMALKSL